MFNTGTIFHFHQESSIQKKCLPEVSTVIVRWFLSVLQMGRSLRLLDSWTSYDTLIPSGIFSQLAIRTNRHFQKPVCHHQYHNITNHPQKHGFPWFPSVAMVLQQWQHASSVVVGDSHLQVARTARRALAESSAPRRRPRQKAHGKGTYQNIAG